jgi:membrane protein implicated in regulation of membrane protease activity
MNLFSAIGRKKSLLMQISLIVLIVYTIASVSLLVFAIQWLEANPHSYLDPKATIAYAIISFLLVVLISAYHLSTLLRRRKRRTDRQRLSRAKFIRAKHRLPSRY